MTPRMFLQPRSKDKKIIAEALGHFDGFQLSATVPAGTISYVRDFGKPFFVDPMAYMFALPPEATIDPKTNKVRDGVTALAGRYSPITKAISGKRSLRPDDIGDAEILNELTANALAYEREKLRPGDINLFNPYVDRYAMLGVDDTTAEPVSTATTPWVLVPPYFLFPNLQSPWYQVSLTCARAAVREKHVGERLCPTIFMSAEVLDDLQAIDQLVADYDEPSFDGVFVWINAFSEEGASPERLSNLLRLIAKLRAQSKAVFKLHGGFFSILAHDLGLQGFSCGLGGRSDRDIHVYRWAPQSGPRLPKFYVPALHRSYSLADSADFMRLFPFLKCDCATCDEAYGSDLDRFTERMKEPEYCERHFLNARKAELTLAKSGVAALLEGVEETLGQLARKNAPGARHLIKWKGLFSDQSDASARPRPSQQALRPITAAR